MKGKWKLGQAFGIGIYVHWTFGLLILFALLGGGVGGLGVATGILFLLAVFGCVILHELGHSLAARRYGIRTEDITLYPIGGVARLTAMPRRPMEELVIAVAGPAVNVGIAVALVPLVFLTGFLNAWLSGFLMYLLAANIVLVLFNLLPAFPMDGGRVFRALLAMKGGDMVQATNTAAKTGKVMAVLLGLAGLGLFSSLGFPANPMLIFIAVFVWLAGEMERQGVGRMYAPRPQAPFGNGGSFFYTVPPRPDSPPAHRAGEWEVLPPESTFRRRGSGYRVLFHSPR